MSVFVAMVVLAGIFLLTQYYWTLLFARGGPVQGASLSAWFWRGLVLPSAGWIVVNLGLTVHFPPLIPEIALAKYSGRSWIPLLFHLTAPGLAVIGTMWAAVSFAYLLSVIVIHAEPRDELLFGSLVTSVLFLPCGVLIGWTGGVLILGLALLVWLVPVTHVTVNLANRPVPPPNYSLATARIKMGKYKDAESAVIKQLENCADDFDGWMMLAELYANHFGDLREADQTIRALCDQSTTTPLQMSIALHRLADWHLKLADNPIAARRALEEIGRRLPNGHFAKMAQLRIRQLPGSREELLEQRAPKIFQLPVLGDALDDAEGTGPATLPRSQVLSQVDELVEKLKRNPNDIPARERFARLCAEQLNKADVAIEQVSLLLGMPGQPDQKRAEWLSLTAAWHLRYRHDRDTAQTVLRRLIDEVPQSAQAFAAQRRLNLMEMEDRQANA